MPILAGANAPWRSAILVEGGNSVAKPTGAMPRCAPRRANMSVTRTGFEQLYDLVSDPYELDNKAKDPTYASDATTLRGLHDQLKSCVGDGCWVP